MNSTAKKFLNLLERAGSTFAEQFLTVMLGTGAASLVLSPHWAQAADRAGFAAIVSIGTSLVTFAVPKLPAGVDALLRVLKTGLQVFLGDLLASSATPSLVHADWRHALAAGVVVMGPAALKVIAALGIPTTLGASVLPAKLDVGSVDPAALDYLDPAALVYGAPVLPDHVQAGLATSVVMVPPVDPGALDYGAPVVDTTPVVEAPQHAAP